jgi:hypothetical protein
MPYQSDRQRRFFHTATARKQGITPAMVHEYDTASRGMHLPESKSKAPMHRGAAMKGLKRAMR